MCVPKSGLGWISTDRPGWSEFGVPDAYFGIQRAQFGVWQAPAHLGDAVSHLCRVHRWGQPMRSINTILKIRGGLHLVEPELSRNGCAGKELGRADEHVRVLEQVLLGGRVQTLTRRGRAGKHTGGSRADAARRV